MDRSKVYYEFLFTNDAVEIQASFRNHLESNDSNVYTIPVKLGIVDGSYPIQNNIERFFVYFFNKPENKSKIKGASTEHIISNYFASTTKELLEKCLTPSHEKYICKQITFKDCNQELVDNALDVFKNIVQSQTIPDNRINIDEYNIEKLHFLNGSFKTLKIENLATKDLTVQQYQQVLDDANKKDLILISNCKTHKITLENLYVKNLKINNINNESNMLGIDIQKVFAEDVGINKCNVGALNLFSLELCGLIDFSNSAINTASNGRSNITFATNKPRQYANNEIIEDEYINQVSKKIFFKENVIEAINILISSLDAIKNTHSTTQANKDLDYLILKLQALRTDYTNTSKLVGFMKELKELLFSPICSWLISKSSSGKVVEIFKKIIKRKMFLPIFIVLFGFVLPVFLKEYLVGFVLQYYLLIVTIISFVWFYFAHAMALTSIMVSPLVLLDNIAIPTKRKEIFDLWLIRLYSITGAGRYFIRPLVCALVLFLALYMLGLKYPYKLYNPVYFITLEDTTQYLHGEILTLARLSISSNKIEVYALLSFINVFAKFLLYFFSYQFIKAVRRTIKI